MSKQNVRGTYVQLKLLQKHLKMKVSHVAWGLNVTNWLFLQVTQLFLLSRCVCNLFSSALISFNWVLNLASWVSALKPTFRVVFIGSRSFKVFRNTFEAVLLPVSSLLYLEQAQLCSWAAARDWSPPSVTIGHRSVSSKRLCFSLNVEAVGVERNVTWRHWRKAEVARSLKFNWSHV